MGLEGSRAPDPLFVLVSPLLRLSGFLGGGGRPLLTMVVKQRKDGHRTLKGIECCMQVR